VAANCGSLEPDLCDLCMAPADMLSIGENLEVRRTDWLNRPETFL
jgi:hypothetical protein